MSAAERPRAEWRRRAAVATAAAIVVFAPGTAAARTSYETRGDTLTITMKIDLRGDGAAQVLPSWRESFESYWGAMNGTETLFGCKIKFVLDAEVAVGREGADQITVRTVGGSDYFVSNVGAGEVTDDRYGTWASNASQAKVAHEMGHLLGLPDEYARIDYDGDGVRDAGEPTIPDPSKAPEYQFTHDWNGNGEPDFDDRDGDGRRSAGEKVDTVAAKPGLLRSLMAEDTSDLRHAPVGDHGRGILGRHLDAIARLHGAPSCSKTYTGRLQGRWIIDDAEVRTEIGITMNVRLRTLGPTPLSLGAGDVLAAHVAMDPSGTTITNHWNWVSKEGLGSCSGEGTTTLGVEDVAGAVYHKRDGADLTPMMGFDIQDGLYLLVFSSQDRYPVSCTFGTDQEVTFLTPPLGRLPNIDSPESDPEIRVLQDGRSVMAGTYSHTFQGSTGLITVEADWRFVAEGAPTV